MPGDRVRFRVKILLTGATGYVGGRLRLALEARGDSLRCLARRPENLRGRVGPQTEVVGGDVRDLAALERAMNGVHVAYYLVHAMGATGDFEKEDRDAARIFGAAALAAGVRRIIYLGGLGNPEEELSPHLRSRQEVGEILRSSGVPTLEFRASIVIGSGSLSFELVRALVERLPVMIVPRWTKVVAQPIAIRDLIDYLVQALDFPEPQSRIYEVGGADITSYEGLMREYARLRRLRRFMLRVPVITPRLSSLWLGFITPVYARIGRKLIESIRHPTIVRDDAALRDFQIRPMGMSAAFERALSREEQQFVESRWFDALSSGGPLRSEDGTRFGNRLADRRSLDVPVSPASAFAPIRRIGGKQGWYACNFLWKLRGAVDLLVGGVGMRRGRPHPDRLQVGDALDFWRVEAFESNRLLRLRAEMRLPGRAWLEFEVAESELGSQIRQTALFDPVGLSGLLYWYGIFPLHGIVFRRMIQGLARAALEASGADPKS